MTNKIETAEKLQGQYIQLLEASNRKLDEQILKLTFFNEMAKAFQSAAYDRQNISGFLFDLLKKKIGMEVFVLFFEEELKNFLIFASDKKLGEEKKNQFLVQILAEYQRVSKMKISPQNLSVVEIRQGSAQAQEMEVDTLSVFPLIVLDLPLGMVGIGLPKGRSLEPDLEKFLRTLATHVALFVENDRVRQIIVNEKNKLETVNKELESFSYSVSHDLRAPLMNIKAFSSLCLKEFGPQLPPRAKSFLENVDKGADRMAELIRDMLELSQVTSAGMHHEPVDLSELAAEIVTELKGTQPARQVDFVASSPLKVEGDKRLLRIVLQNLLSNAWKYTSKHPRARIELGTTKKEDKIVFYLRDDGAGFDPQFTKKLFAPFHRLHTSSEFPGTGVGLATVQRIIHRHGGKIWAEGATEKGATFYFTLPQ